MILILDNYDSFTHNIAQSLGSLELNPVVVRSDTIGVRDIAGMAPDAIVISPGPGGPNDAGISCRAIEVFSGKIPILGVCLGHQCIGEVFGARVTRAETPVHGKTSEVFHDGHTIFSGLRNPFHATRYHSLIVAEDSLGDELEVSAYTMSGEVMGLRRPGFMTEGVQFHPESIATPQGMMIFRNFVERFLTMKSAA
jgi:anthranilate synthase/aminodeoxychorismate synthase-like glutamine amidotransferase